ncbi:Transglutaminase-like superfamily protein [Fibrobacter sp. UWB8]|uniref:transglutaminase-like domain-containing protein n=1 Tax=unclassified Fibrobacter TaxID=2634177 RepID=UPI0009108433|nr:MULTISPECIES: transglutaminase-like domain-containing protein [unclassified Fibrobacter]PWJ65819.1 transglutaminase superfamily protein [Fibrobacter sp. UWB6]SHF92615.1 Transglutaminase-like superfamily protein [Fibrobacter sp. UWB8]
MMSSEKVDIRYAFKVLFLCLASVNLGHTFDFLWLGVLFAIYFVAIGVLNATRRREFAKRPRYNKILAYGAIVPLALFWVMTPSVENGVSPYLIFLPGIYLLYLAALQERSRGNGGFEVFVAFDGVGALLFGMYMVPHGWGFVGLVGFLLALCAYSRRGTALYKYGLFLLVIAALGAISYGGWQYWKTQRYRYGAQMAENYYQRERMMGFDPVAALGSFGSNYNSRYNSQVVLRVWDKQPSRYFKAASYEKYVAGIWKLPTKFAKRLYPAYYQVDYAVFETADSLTKADSLREVEQIWVQSTLNNFGFVFAPYGVVGFAAKDVDSLSYYAGGMVQGLDGNGKRSDWHYFKCKPLSAENTLGVCSLPDSLMAPSEGDLLVGERYLPLIDTVIAAMGLRDIVPTDSISANSAATDSAAPAKSMPDSLVLQKMLAYYLANFTYSLSVPGMTRWNGAKNEPLAVFWREKQGFCEYYATLATLVLRRLNIPARYVTGFANPEVVEGLPYSIFRRKHSHAWVEAYVDNRWVIFDPTPPILPQFAESPSWWSVKWEGVRGRLARVMHALKEGEWRRVVDSWQNQSTALLESPILYAVLVILVAGFAGRKIYVTYKLSSKNRAYVSARSLEWVNKLNRAERDLARAGFRRELGETVGKFAARVKIALSHLAEDQIPPKKLQKARQALFTLNEYESNRWRH